MLCGLLVVWISTTMHSTAANIVQICLAVIALRTGMIHAVYGANSFAYRLIVSTLIVVVNGGMMPPQPTDDSS